MENPINKERQRQKPAIFVVDDDSLVRRGLMRTLQTMNLSAEISDYESAIDLLREIEQSGTVPTIVISDYQMPFMRGDELCKKLREMKVNGRPPVIFVVTGSYSKSLERELIEAGAERVYAKPINVDITRDIQSRIKEILKEL